MILVTLKKRPLFWFAALCLVLTFSGCQKKDGASAALTIRWVGSYSQDEKTTAVVNKIVARYKELSGTTVEFESIDGSNLRTWVTTQHAAKNAPELLEMNYNWAWDDYAKDYVVDMAPYLDAPNPYNDNQILRSTLSPMLMEQAKIPGSTLIPTIPSNVAGVKIIYNRDMFKQAGITKEPFTLNEFYDACEKLRAAGFVPFAFANAKVNDAYMNWWMHNFVSQLDQGLRDRMDLNGNKFVIKNELIAATDKGLIDFTKPPFIDGFRMLRDFSKHWNSDFNSTDRETCLDLFLGKRAAMTNLLNSNKARIDQYEGLDIDYGLMTLPAVTTENHPNGSGRPLNNGGRIVSGYALTKYSDASRLAAAADFMAFLLSPDPLTWKMDELSQLPPLADMPLSDQARGWLTAPQEDILYANYFGYATSKEFTDFQVLSSQIFLTDKSMTPESYAAQLNVEWKKMAEAAKIENNWNAANNYGIK